MEALNKLSSLGISINSLYLAQDKQLNIHLSDKPYVFHVVLKDNRGNVDCKISSMGANLWARTLNGQNSKKYTTLQCLEKALISLIDKKVDTDGVITFSISNEVYTI
jgi:hypothetical protein